MSRIKSFDLPHKALRNCLSQFLHLAGKTNFTDNAQIKKLKHTGAELFALLESHNHSENEFVLKKLEVKEPGSSKHDLDDHEKIEKEVEELKLRLQNLTVSSDSTTTHQFYLEISQFISMYFMHLHHEETVTEKLLHKHFSDEELIEHRNEIMSSIEFPELTLWLKYAVPALVEIETYELLKGVKKMVPAENFQSLLTELKLVLPEHEYRQLAKQVC